MWRGAKQGGEAECPKTRLSGGIVKMKSSQASEPYDDWTLNQDRYCSEIGKAGNKVVFHEGVPWRTKKCLQSNKQYNDYPLLELVVAVNLLIVAIAGGLTRVQLAVDGGYNGLDLIELLLKVLGARLLAVQRRILLSKTGSVARTWDTICSHLP